MDINVIVIFVLMCKIFGADLGYNWFLTGALSLILSCVYMLFIAVMSRSRVKFLNWVAYAVTFLPLFVLGFLVSISFWVTDTQLIEDLYFEAYATSVFVGIVLGGFNCVLFYQAIDSFKKRQADKLVVDEILQKKAVKR